jgi:hypothetical protein
LGSWGLYVLAVATKVTIQGLAYFYIGRKITASLSYVTERGGGKMERAGGSKTAKSLCELA